MAVATYGRNFGNMERHDSASRNERMKAYAGIGGDYTKREYDPNWNKQVRPAPRPRYILSPAQLRRMGIGR